MKHQKKACITLALPEYLLILLREWKKKTKNYPQVYLEKYKCKIKKTKMTKFINIELDSESNSESELESDTELKSKSELKSDNE